MLRQLRIRDLAIAKDVCIEPDEGFSVLTGETGAGKSILLDGLGLVLGDRFSKEMISPGKDRAMISAIFGDVSTSLGVSDYLKEIGIFADAEDQIEIIRSMSCDGRSISRINGIVISLTTLRELGERLVNISSQSENRLAGKKNTYSEILDSYADVTIDGSTYEECYHNYLDALKELEETEGALRDKVMMTDIYSYQIKEIDEVKLSDPNEEEKLEKQKTKLKDAERITKYASIVKRALSQNDKGATASYMIERAQHAVESINDVLENADDISVRLESLRCELEDIAERVSGVIEPDMEDPAAALDKIETRLDKIAKLKKKYGADIAEVMRYRDQIAEKLDLLESGDLALKEVQKKVEKTYAAAIQTAKELSGKRTESAEKLSSVVADNLRYLDIPKGLFKIRVNQKYDPDGKLQLSRTGIDEVTFLFSANSGYPLQELYKIASGGELSRTMLALKCALAKKQDVPTIVFDETDTGVSGATSERIGRKLKELSEKAQVISVTHSPQVAALGDSHFLIRKIDNGEGAESIVQKLNDEERVNEIARIIGGVTVTSKQIQAAKEMLDKNHK